MKNCESTIIENNTLEMEYSHAVKQQSSVSIPTVGQASRLSTKSWERHLPHFQTSSDYYFITFATYRRKLLNPFQKDIILNTLHFLNDKKYTLFAAVVLNDHVHVIIEPKEAISKIMHSIKSYTAHKINEAFKRNGKFWQNESMDKIIRSERELFEKLKYIINNPIKANLSQKYTDYKWLYVKDWLND